MKTIEEKAKAYDEALERAKAYHRNELSGSRKEMMEYIFPQLRESEDERMYKAVRSIISQHYDRLMSYQVCRERRAEFVQERDEVLAYLEKKKEQKELPLMDGNADLYFDEWNQQKQNPTKRQCFEEGIRYARRLQKEQKQISFNEPYNPDDYEVVIEGNATSLKRKEQKQNATEDMPYIADEHFYEREPADSFKYRLAEYMTKNCKKGEGPYGYSYNISSESILQMAKEELIKRGELKEPKPVELSEEDKMILDNVSYILIGLNYRQIAKDYKRAVEKLIYARPSWRPSEEQMNALEITPRYFPQGCLAQVALISLYEQFNEQLKKLQTTAP